MWIEFQCGTTIQGKTSNGMLVYALNEREYVYDKKILHFVEFFFSTRFLHEIITKNNFKINQKHVIVTKKQLFIQWRLRC